MQSCIGHHIANFLKKYHKVKRNYKFLNVMPLNMQHSPDHYDDQLK